MSAAEDTVTVAVLDSFAAELVEIIESGIPSNWALRYAVDYTAGHQLSALSDADVVFAMWAPVTREMLEASGRLKLIQKLGAGVDRIDLDYCRKAGIAVARLAGINAVPVAEHVVMFMLAALRRLPRSHQRIRSGDWFKEEARGYQRELRGKTVGLIGVGHVGREVARRLAPFEVEMLYYDVVKLPDATEQELGLRFTQLDELVATADIVSLHVPLTRETRHLVNDERIGAMKPESILVNCARGGLVDEAALARALREGRIAAAALDTFDHEPLRDLGLVGLDNVIATPHSAGATRDNFVMVIDRAVQNAVSYLDGNGLPESDVAFAPNPPAPS